MAVIIREYGNVQRSTYGEATVLTSGVLETDKPDPPLPIKSVTPTAGGVDSPQLLGSTRIVELFNGGAAAVFYAVRPKARATTLAATTSHRFIPSGGAVLEAVHGGAFINFKE